jgi:hypothetical protein
MALRAVAWAECHAIGIVSRAVNLEHIPRSLERIVRGAGTLNDNRGLWKH